MALDAELVLYRNCEWTEKREFRPKQRNRRLIVFFADTSVKDIRKILLCKRKDNSADEKKRLRLRRRRSSALEYLQSDTGAGGGDESRGTHGASCGDAKFPDVAGEFVDAEVDVAFFWADVKVHIELARSGGWVEVQRAFVLRAHAEAGETVYYHAGVGEHDGRQVLPFHRQRLDGPGALE